MSIVSCPKCNDKVTVPPKAPTTARVRCPLCQEEYELADALAQLPPLLIVVSGMPEEEPILAGVGADSAGDRGEFGTDFGELAGASPAGVTDAAFDTAVAGEEGVAPTPKFRSAPRRRPKEKSMVGELVKIVLGGVIGLGLGVIALWWVAGVDLGLAPTIAKIGPMRWVLPPKILAEADETNVKSAGSNEGTGSETKSNGDLNTQDIEPIKKKNGAATAKQENGNTKKKPESSGTEAKKPASEDPFTDIPDPFGVDSKKSGSPTESLNIGGPLETPANKSEPKGNERKKSEKKKDEPADDSEKSKTEPAAVRPEEGTEPAEEAKNKGETKKSVGTKRAETKPEEAKPAEEKPTPSPPSPPAATATADFRKSIDTAKAALATFDQTDETDRDARRTAVVALYDAVADLGRVTTQVNLEDADHADKLPALREALFGVANQPQKLNAIGTLAAKRLDTPDADAGILVAGKVTDFKAAGDLFETTLELVKDKRSLTIVTSKNPQDTCKIDDQVLVVGKVVRDPKEQLSGYKGDATLVIRAGHTLVIPPQNQE